MRYQKPDFNYYKTNHQRAQAFANQAAQKDISRPERETYVTLARLYLDLALLDARLAPGQSSAPGEAPANP